MTYEELTIGGKVVCWAFALMPFGAGWLGEQFGRWLRRQYEMRRERKLGIPHTPPTGKKRQVKMGIVFALNPYPSKAENPPDFFFHQTH